MPLRASIADFLRKYFKQITYLKFYGPVVKPGYNAPMAWVRLRVQIAESKQRYALQVSAGPFLFFILIFHSSLKIHMVLYETDWQPQKVYHYKTAMLKADAL